MVWLDRKVYGNLGFAAKLKRTVGRFTTSERVVDASDYVGELVYIDAVIAGVRSDNLGRKRDEHMIPVVSNH
jgi:hypothetical protein